MLGYVEVAVCCYGCLLVFIFFLIGFSGWHGGSVVAAIVIVVADMGYCS